MRFSVPPRLAFAAIAVLSLALLVARSRPLARFSGGIEPLLYASGLTAPRALLSLPDGTILAAEQTGQTRRVVEIGTDGQLTPVAATALPALALGWAADVWAVAPAADGSIYISLTDNGALIRLRDEGGRVAAQVLTMFGGSGGGGTSNAALRPTGVAVGPDGTVHVAVFATMPNRAGSGQVVRVGPDGRWVPAFEGLNFPVGLAFDARGELHVLELAERYDERAQAFARRSGRVMRLGPAAHQRRTLMREVDLPSGMVFTPAGDLYLTENAYVSAAGEARLLRVPAEGMRQ